MSARSDAFLETIAELIAGGVSVRATLETLAEGPRSDYFAQTARDALALLNAGINVASALDAAGPLAGPARRPYRVQMNRTGDIAGTLRVYLEESARMRKLAGDVIRSVAYPACVLLFAYAGLVAALTIGIPWLRRAGLILSASDEIKILKGLAITAVASVAPLSIGILAMSLAVKNRVARARAWSMVSSLAKAGIPPEWCREEVGWLAAAADRYDRLMIAAAEATGDYEDAFERISGRHSLRLENIRELAVKVAEPAATLSAGIALIGISLTVFAPFAGFTGGVL